MVAIYEQVVFAGGGHRCWWQAGFWDVVKPAIGLAPRVIAGVSAGAATACLVHANDSRDALDYYRRVLSGNPRNMYPRNLLRAGRAVFPHNEIYRSALRHLLGGAHFRRLQTQAPEIRVQFARIPRWLGPRSAVAIGLLAYNLEKYTLRSLHPRLGRRLGFTREIVRVQDCRDEDELISLIIASSCTPPFTPIEYRGGRPTIDGGLVDNVPVDALDADGGATLVLTTRRYPGRDTVFEFRGRTYVQPSNKAPVSSWDYTAPDAYARTYALGRADGEAFARWYARQGRPTIARYDSNRETKT
ncbi:MAG: patatin-like phospholipase family protein [Burkholderiaceae bacterium]|nr:patatin-like phospholipase family protein [Burkholderiaceae bacterium]